MQYLGVTIFRCRAEVFLRDACLVSEKCKTMTGTFFSTGLSKCWLNNQTI